MHRVRFSIPTWGWVAILSFAVGIAYANTFRVPFLLDDHDAIVDNQSIQKLLDWHVFWAEPSRPTAGRPLLNAFFAVNHAVDGDSVVTYHVVNWLIHICAGLALFGVVNRALSLPTFSRRIREASRTLGGVSALLWLVHPAQTICVTYISQRAESLMTLFYLLALYAFLRSLESPLRRWWLASVAACAAGMLTKETMVSAPIGILLCDYCMVTRSCRQSLRMRWRMYVGLAATWFLLAMVIAASHWGARGIGDSPGVSTVTYAVTECAAVLNYLRLGVWPCPLVFDYGPQVLAHGVGAMWPYLAGVAIGLAVTVLMLKSNPPAGFLPAFFVCALVPTSSIVPIVHQPIAENRMYLPLAPVIVAGVIGGHLLLRRRGLGFAVAATLSLGLTSAARNRVFRSERSVWEDTVRKRPDNARAHNNLGNILAKTPGRRPDAIAEFEQAVRLAPAYGQAHSNLANQLALTPGREKDSFAEFEAALKFSDSDRPELVKMLRADYASTRSNFALKLIERGRYAEAKIECEAALRLNARSAEAHNNLGNALRHLAGQADRAIEEYRQAVQLRPDFAEAWFNLAASLLDDPSRRSEANYAFDRALRLRPDLRPLYLEIVRPATGGAVTR